MNRSALGTPLDSEVKRRRARRPGAEDGRERYLIAEGLSSLEVAPKQPGQQRDLVGRWRPRSAHASNVRVRARHLRAPVTPPAIAWPELDPATGSVCETSWTVKPGQNPRQAGRTRGNSLAPGGVRLKVLDWRPLHDVMIVSARRACDSGARLPRRGGSPERRATRGPHLSLSAAGVRNQSLFDHSLGAGRLPSDPSGVSVV